MNVPTLKVGTWHRHPSGIGMHADVPTTIPNAANIAKTTHFVLPHTYSTRATNVLTINKTAIGDLNRIQHALTPSCGCMQSMARPNHQLRKM